ncbi:MAG: D-alanyl-D-alanine carboxypeptidase [Candidatus Blackburnbacteria bacterium]|nr:D-alanyl-D-alanine carboxypeptidase [Candidatus Blackburnbacteria bacterium]
MPKKPTSKTSPFDSTQFLFLVLFVLIMLISWGIFFAPQKEAKVSKKLSQEPKVKVSTEAKVPTPQLKNQVTPPSSATARSYYAIDVKTGTQLLAKREDEPQLPASTTKMATALVAMSYYKPDDVITVGVTRSGGHKMGLVYGEQITTRDLLYGLLVFSGNDAAEVLAQNYPGGRGEFVASMNNLAKKLELTNTNFTNPAGFDEYLHFSSAKDLVKLALHGMENSLFAQIVGTKNIKITSVDGSIVHSAENTNRLIEKMPGILGVKTGWTENSGQDLVTLYERDGHRVMLAVLGSTDRFRETQTLLNWIFDNYEWK